MCVFSSFRTAGTLSTQPRIKTSAILKDARVKVKRKHTRYICTAISGMYDIPYERRQEVRQMIMKRLKPFSTYEDWLVRRHGAFAASKGIHRRSEGGAGREGRLQWLDSMIKEFEAKGD